MEILKIDNENRCLLVACLSSYNENEKKSKCVRVKERVSKARAATIQMALESDLFLKKESYKLA